MTDFRALCAELLSALESEGYAHWVNGPDEDDLCLRARAALADEPAVPSASADTHYEWELEDANGELFDSTLRYTKRTDQLAGRWIIQ